MSETIISSLSLDGLRDFLHEAGYRVETLTDQGTNMPYLRTATGGISCDIRPGNRLQENANNEDATRFADVALMAIIQIAGEMPLEIVNRWNATRRFGRLQFSKPFVALCLDISVLNGVTPGYLRAQIAVWDHLVQDLVPFLRNALSTEANASNKAPQLDPSVAAA